jgi:hypothetical protein
MKQLRLKTLVSNSLWLLQPNLPKKSKMASNRHRKKQRYSAKVISLLSLLLKMRRLKLSILLSKRSLVRKMQRKLLLTQLKHSQRWYIRLSESQLMSLLLRMILHNSLQLNLCSNRRRAPTRLKRKVKKSNQSQSLMLMPQMLILYKPSQRLSKQKLTWKRLRRARKKVSKQLSAQLQMQRLSSKRMLS